MGAGGAKHSFLRHDACGLFLRRYSLCALAYKRNYKNDGLKPLEVPGVLIKSHGVFAFGKDGDASVYNATVIEEVAKMATITEAVNPSVQRADKFMMDKHYLRKHGKNAYYGQSK